MTKHLGAGEVARGGSIVDGRISHGVVPHGGVQHQIDEFRAAISMLTRLPGGTVSGELTGARMFALVGALTGLAGAVPLLLFDRALAPAAAILAVATMAVLSGALHLDGLADTADALVAPGGEAAERARKDPSVGVAGAVALILVLGLEVTSLTLLAAGPGPFVAGLACLVGGAGSRVAPVVLARAARRRAAAAGMGAWFSDRVTARDATIAGSSGVLLAVAAASWSGSAAVLVGGLVGFATGTGLGLALVRLRGRLDGDGYGATVELTFAATVLAIAALVRGPAA